MASLLYSVLLICSCLVAGGYSSTFCETEVAAGRSCFSEPADCKLEAECEMTMTSMSMGMENSTKFTLSGMSQGWVAIGFSGDQLMGEDDVIMCVRDGTDVSLLDRYNIDGGKNNIAKTTSAIDNGLVLDDMSYDDGVIRCEFTRDDIIMPVDQQHFGLDFGDSLEFYILFGRGPATNGVPSMHQTNPWSSESLVNLTDTSIINRAGRTTPNPRGGPSSTTSAMPETTAGASQSQEAAYLVLHLVFATLTMLVTVY